MKRLFFVLFGVGAGVAVGVWGVQRLERTVQGLRPDNLAASAGRWTEQLGGRVMSAVAEGRVAAAAREAELRSQLAERRAAR